MDFKPQKIGKYLLLEKLAAGGMAEVYRAKASGAGGFEKQLAVKRILPHYASNEEFRRMFEYEARLSSQLNHANIAQIYDFVKSNETYLLAMEYIDGKNLRQFVNKAKKLKLAIPIEFSVFVLNEVCKGLDYAHKKKDDLTGLPLNIIHRDMSPQNIMLSYDGAVKIVDFGIAKAKDRVDETRSGVIKGKFGYMSPEQANGDSISHQSDVFSTGIILFELTTGNRLFTADSDMATLRLIQDCIIPPPSRFNPKIQSDLEKIILKALTKDRKARYSDAGQFHRSLQEFLVKHHSSYTQKEASTFIQTVFKEEISSERRRIETLHKQSIPFSLGSAPAPQEDLDEEPLDGDVTRSENEENTGVTSAEMSEGKEPSLFSPEQPTLLKEMPGPESNASSAPSVPEESKGSATIPGVEIVQTSKDIDEDREKTGKTAAPQVAPPPRTEDVPKEPESFVALNDPTAIVKRRPKESSLNDLGAPLPKTESQKSPVGEPSVTSMPTAPITLQKEDRTPFDPWANDDDAILEGMKRRKWNKRVSTITSLTMLFGVIIGTGYFYQLYMSGQVPMLIDRYVGSSDSHTPLPEPPTTAPPTPSKQTNRPPIAKKQEAATAKPPPSRNLVGECGLEIETDPPFAKLFILNDKEYQYLGKSPFELQRPCNSQVTILARLEGRRPTSLNYVLSSEREKKSISLPILKFGVLVLSADDAAQVFIPNQTEPLYISPDRPLEIPLAADQPQQIRVKNNKGVNQIISAKVQAGRKTKMKLSLLPSLKTRKTPHR